MLPKRPGLHPLIGQNGNWARFHLLNAGNYLPIVSTAYCLREFSPPAMDAIVRYLIIFFFISPRGACARKLPRQMKLQVFTDFHLEMLTMLTKEETGSEGMRRDTS